MKLQWSRSSFDVGEDAAPLRLGEERRVRGRLAGFRQGQRRAFEVTRPVRPGDVLDVPGLRPFQ